MKFLRQTLAAITVVLVGSSAAYAEPSPLEIYQSERWQRFIENQDVEYLWPNRITNARNCLRKGGRWVDRVAGQWSGCVKNGKQVGVWALVNEAIHPIMFQDVEGGSKGRLGLTLRDGDIESLSYYVNGLREGEAVFFNADGSFNGVIPFTKGKANGAITRHHPNGAVSAELTYVHGKREGRSQSWSNKCVKLEDVSFKNDLLQGPAKFWNQDGILVREGDYNQNQKEGIWRFYDAEQGTLLEEGPFVKDVREGTWTEFFTTGTRFREVVWKAGKRVDANAQACEAQNGTWVVELGNFSEGCQVGNQPHGLQLIYYPTTEVRAHIEMNSGLKQGLERWFYPDGKTLFEGQWEQGKPVGIHVAFNPDGTEKARFDLRQTEVEVVRYLPNGKPHEKGTYRDGVRHGIWTLWSDNGIPLEEDTWTQGERIGPFKRWRDGVLSLEGEWRGEQRYGRWKAYYGSGRLAWEGDFNSEGQRSGNWRMYYPSGVLKGEGAMMENWEMGYWRFYYDNAQLKSEGFYNAGSYVGEWTFYFKSGALWRTAMFRDGYEENSSQQQCEESGGEWQLAPESRLAGCVTCRWRQGLKGQEDEKAASEDKAAETLSEIEGLPKPPHGEPVVDETPATDARTLAGWVERISINEWTFWYPSGEVEKRGPYANGKEEGTWTFWYPNGNVRLKGTYTAGQEQGRWEGFYEDGTPQYIGEFQSGTPQGPWLRFHRNGSKALEATYKEGKQDGIWKRFAANGQIIEEGRYENGKASGLWRSYFDNGTPKSEGNYMDGKREGPWKWYRADGSLWREASYEQGREKR